MPDRRIWKPPGIFSPDDYWVVVQDGGSSLGISLRLFRREKGAAYKEMTERDVGRTAELAAMKETHFPEQELLDHRFMKLLTWSADSKRFLFALSGHGGDKTNHIRITEWTGIYDLANGTIGFDLRQMNQGVFQVEKFGSRVLSREQPLMSQQPVRSS